MMRTRERTARSTLHTIGYEGISIDDLMAALRFAEIDLLIDVREVPISRKAGFSKFALASHLTSHGIEYLHLKGLGDPKPGRDAARAGHYESFELIYGTHLRSDYAQADLIRGIDVSSGRAACLLCFERDHANCHRRIVAEEMARRSGCRLVHIDVVRDLGARAVTRNKRLNHGTIGIVG